MASTTASASEKSVGNDVLAQMDVNSLDCSHTNVFAKVCASKDANTQVLLHLADDLDSMIDGKM